ncbi:putative hemolysin [Enterobacter chuandaensis]
MRTIILLAAVLTVTGCVTHNEPVNLPGMANPASEHCITLGGKLDIVQTPAGETGYCTLPSGERTEEWALFRRDIPHMKHSTAARE